MSILRICKVKPFFLQFSGKFFCGESGQEGEKIEIFQTGVPHKTEANPKVGWLLELWEGFRKKIIFAPHGLFQGRRLSLSEHSANFFLKGGLLFKVWNEENHRATLDIDFLAKHSNDTDRLHAMVKDVSSIEYFQDAITFDTQLIRFKTTQVNGPYAGQRASFFARLGKTRIPLMIDFGFNDLIVPEPQIIHYPTLLPLSAPKLLGYTAETMFAEKLETIIARGSVNTRMKDFYDLWVMIHSNQLDHKVLQEAIQKVFANRNQQSYSSPSIPTDFSNDLHFHKLWKGYLDALGCEELSFRKVTEEINHFLGQLSIRKAP